MKCAMTRSSGASRARRKRAAGKNARDAANEAVCCARTSAPGSPKRRRPPPPHGQTYLIRGVTFWLARVAPPGRKHMHVVALSSPVDGFRLDEVTCRVSCALRIRGSQDGDAQDQGYIPSEVARRPLLCQGLARPDRVGHFGEYLREDVGETPVK